MDNLINQLKSNPHVAGMRMNNDYCTQRVVVTVKNGAELSIIQGPYTYGGDSGFFEIAPMSDGNLWTTKKAATLFEEEDSGDQVLGYCNIEKVEYYIAKLAKMEY